MYGEGWSSERAQALVSGCELVVALLGRLGRAAWPLVERAAEAEAGRRPVALTAARQTARDLGCAAMLDHTLQSCRRVARSSGSLREHPRLDELLDALDAAVTAAALAGMLDAVVVDVLAAPQRALSALLVAPLDAPASTTRPVPRQRIADVEPSGALR